VSTGFVVMLEFAFKVRETTKRGRLLKKIFEESGSECCDNPIPLSKACSKCLKDVEDKSTEVIECSKCAEKHHIPCLTHAIPRDFITFQSTNPCVWWFCVKCVSKANSTSQHDVDLTIDEHAKLASPSDAKLVSPLDSKQVDFMNNISNQISTLKSELLANMNDAIESKMNSVLSKISDKPSCVSPNRNPPWVSLTAPDPNKSVIPEGQSHPTRIATPAIQGAAITPPEVLILSPKDGINVNDEDMNKVKKSVELKLKNVQVEFIRPNVKNKKIAVGFKSTDLRQNGENLLNSNDHLTKLGYQSKLVNKMLPKISLFNVSSDIFEDVDISGCSGDEPQKREQIRELEKQMVIDKILDKNAAVKQLHADEHTLKVVYLKKISQYQYTIILKVSPAIRAAILKDEGRIYLGNSSHIVSDRFHVEQCYHCQGIGHTSKNCPDIDGDPICMYCMG
jgi:hypothetical protein